MSSAAGAAEYALATRDTIVALLVAAASFLGSFRDFHEPFLNELRRSRHGIRVDPDSGEQVRVPPLVSFRSRATQLDLRTAFH